MPGAVLNADELTSSEKERNMKSYEHYLRSDVIGIGVGDLWGTPKWGIYTSAVVERGGRWVGS